MAILGDLVVRLAGDSRPLDRTLARQQQSIERFSKDATRSVARVAASVAAAAGFGGAGATIGFGVKLAAEAEQAQVAFEVMLGSAQDAANVLSEIEQFAASTPFQTEGLIQSARVLFAFGETADSVVPVMRRLGDIAAGTQSDLADLAQIFGRVRAGGRASMEEINRLIDRGVPIMRELAAVMNVTEAEVRSLVSAGKVGFPEFSAAINRLTDEGGQFAGMMARQSSTIAGLWSTLKDNVTLQVRGVGEVIVRELDLSRILKKTIEVVESYGHTVRHAVRDAIAFGREWAVVTAAMGSAAAAIYITNGALRAFQSATRVAAAAQVLLHSVTGWKGMLQLAAGAAAATVALNYLNDKFADIDSQAEQTESSLARTTNGLKAQTDELQKVVAGQQAAANAARRSASEQQQKQVQKSVGDAVRRAREDLALLRGATREEIERYNLLAKGANPYEVERLRIMQMQVDQARKLAEAKREEIQAEKDRIAAAKGELDAMKGRAKSLADSARTPGEKLRDDLAELMKLGRTGSLDLETIGRLRDKAIGEYRASERDQRPDLGAIAAGSSEDLRYRMALNRQRFGNEVDDDERRHKEIKEIEKEAAEKADEELELLRERLKPILTASIGV